MRLKRKRADIFAGAADLIFILLIFFLIVAVTGMQNIIRDKTIPLPETTDQRPQTTRQKNSYIEIRQETQNNLTVYLKRVDKNEKIKIGESIIFDGSPRNFTADLEQKIREVRKTLQVRDNEIVSVVYVGRDDSPLQIFVTIHDVCIAMNCRLGIKAQVKTD